MNNALAQSAQQSGLNPSLRQPPPSSVQNASMIQHHNGGAYPLSQSIPNSNGIASYAKVPNNAQHAQSYGGGGYAIGQVPNPTMNLPENSRLYQHSGSQYDVYPPQQNFYQAGYQAQTPYYYPQSYQTIPAVPQMNYIQQQLPIDNQYGGYQQMNNVQYNQGYLPPQQAAQQQAQPIVSQPSAPVPAQQQTEKRVKRLLAIVDPKTGEDVIKSNEIATVAAPVEAPTPPQQPPIKEEIVEEDGDEARRKHQEAFRRSVLDAAGVTKEGEVKELSVLPEAPVQNIPKTVQQPAPASSAPPPTININEEPKIQQYKAASMEPSIHIEAPSNDVHLAPERSASPTLAATPEIKEQQQEDEDFEKLLDLETRFKDLYNTNGEEIESQVYSLDVLSMIHEIVKCYKKTLPPVDLDLLKRKGLDIQSELPQQMQGRPKYTNPTNTFNPGWNSNQQIVGNRNKLYIGRHSDNKNMRKKPMPTRASFDRTPRQPPPPAILDLRKAENAWKPKRRGEPVDINEDEKKYETLRKEIRSLLNKITPTNYDELIQDFFKLDVGQNERYQQIAIEVIFDKAVEEPKFCSLYTKLCKEQVDRGKRTAGSFFYTLVRKVQATFEGDSMFDNNIKEITTQLNEETDDKKKADLAERLEMLKGKEKRYILGNIKFISHLYTVDLIIDQVIAFCLSKLHQMFDGTKDEIYVQYGIELLELVANIYFGNEKKKARNDDPKSGPDNVQSFVNWLSTSECKKDVSTKIRVLIMNFEDFMKTGYAKRLADTGPKTIKQIHEDVKKEDEINKTERLAYEDRHRDSGVRFQNQRQQYVGRASLDRKNPQEKRINAAVASNSIGNSGPPKKNTSLRTAMNTKDTLSKPKASYFSQLNKEGGGGPDADDWTTVGKTGPSRNDSRKSSLERN